MLIHYRKRKLVEHEDENEYPTPPPPPKILRTRSDVAMAVLDGLPANMIDLTQLEDVSDDFLAAEISEPVSRDIDEDRDGTSDEDEEAGTYRLGST